MATPNMNLELPIPTVTLGPEWANELNAALELVDSHDHSTGKGVRVKPDGLNINTDLDIQTNNLNSVLSLRLTTQPSIPVGALDVQSLYSFDGNLYYNNDNGDSVRITNGTAIDASAVGGIGGDYGTTPAFAEYINVSKKYFFNTDTDRFGAIESGALTIKETDVLSSNGVTISAPPALAADYSLTFAGALPGSTQLLTVSNAGVLDYADTDETSIETTGAGVIQVKDLGITEAKIGNLQVTSGKIANANVIEAKIANSAVTTNKIAAGAVTSSRLQAGAVGPTELANGSVTGLKMSFVESSTSVGLGGSANIVLSVSARRVNIFFTGTNAYWARAAGGTATWTWSGSVSGTIATGVVGTAAVTSVPLSAFNLQILGLATNQTFTLTFSAGTIAGGTINISGIQAT